MTMTWNLLHVDWNGERAPNDPGVGLGGGVSCGASGCGSYITVAAIGSVNLPMVTAACPFGAALGAATCAQVPGLLLRNFN